MPQAQSDLRDEILHYVVEQYGDEPAYLWRKFPDYAVLRHGDNRKWYAIFMVQELHKLGLAGTSRVQIMNVKCDPAILGSFLSQSGFLSAYHMNRRSWLTILLDGSVDMQTIIFLLNASFDLTATRHRLKQLGIMRPQEWLVPANPKYYDIENEFAEGDIIHWKQSNHIAVDDIVYIYVAAPSSAVRYKCRVLEVNIPRKYEKGDLRIRRVMRIECLRKYDANLFGRAKLREFGLSAVRGPRHMPAGLSAEIERLSPA